MKLKLLPLFLLIGVVAFATSFNYSSALINAPTAEVLESMGYYIAINHAQSFSSSSNLLDPRAAGEEDANLNFAYHVNIPSSMFKLNIEAGLTIYSMFSNIKDGNGLAGNIKIQFFQDPTDPNYKQKFDFDKSPIFKYLPSMAIGVRNITSQKYMTSIGPVPPYYDENGNEYTSGANAYDTKHGYANSFYIAFTKKFNIGNFFIKGHLGWGTGIFQGVKEVDRNIGLVYGVSTTIFPINKISPLRVMFDYDGNKYSIGAQLIYNNPQLMSLAQNENAKKFIPGFVFNLAITDIDELIHSYGDKGWSPKIEFGLGLTNNAYLAYAGNGNVFAKRTIRRKKVKKIKKVKKVKKVKPKKSIVQKAQPQEKKKLTAEEARALAKQRALEARRKAMEARKRALAASTGKTAQPKTSITKAQVENAFSARIKRSITFLEENGTIKFIPKTVRFKVNSTQLYPIAYGALNEIGNFLKKNPNIKIEIQGFTDNTGNRAQKIQLSQKRANVIKNYLIKKFGIAADRLVAKGFGPDKPRYSNKTPIGRAKNRRVEFVILK